MGSLKKGVAKSAKPQGPETSLLEEVSHLDAAPPVRGGLCLRHCGAHPPDLWLLCRLLVLQYYILTLKSDVILSVSRLKLDNAYQH